MNRIMIVDDEPDLLRMIEMYLKAWGFDVDTFSDPIKALAHFQTNPTLYSLVLTDIRMPGMSGLELAQHILRIKPDVKIMLMTAYEMSSADLQHTLPMVTHKDIMRKPFRLKQICEGVKRQLQVATSLRQS